MWSFIESKAFSIVTALVIVVVLFIANFIFGSNWVSRSYGGETTIKLDENRKLMNVTWKRDSLWILTREMREEEKAESYIYKEDSNFGILQGTIHIVETKGGIGK